MVDAVDRMMTELRSACAKEQIVRSHHVIYAQEAIAALRAELEQVKQTLAVRDHESDFLKRRGDKAVKRAEAAERLAGARVKALIVELKQATHYDCIPSKTEDAIDNAIAYLSALAEPAGEVEPVAWLYDWTDDNGTVQTEASTQKIASVNFKEVRNVRPLYSTPPDASAIREAMKDLLEIIKEARRDEDFDANTCNAGGLIFGDVTSEAIEAAEAALAGAKP